MSTITIAAYDDSNNQLFSYQVGFAFEINVQQLLQLAFVNAQSASQPDPFSYTLEYYGYSQSAQYPGYLGYEPGKHQHLRRRCGSLLGARG